MISINYTRNWFKFSGILVVFTLLLSPFLTNAQQITTPPTAITTFANNINIGLTANGNSAYLNGRVNPNGLQTFYWFEYGSTQNLGFKTQEVTMSYASQLSDVFVNVVGLPYGNNYYRIVARSNAGQTYGSITSFVVEEQSTSSGGTVLKEKPTATTLPATQISPISGSAYFNGQVNPRGQYTTAWFEYGPNANVSYKTGHQAVGSGRLAVDINVFTLGLYPGTNYYRIVAQNESGIVKGSLVSLVIESQNTGTSNTAGSTGQSGTSSGGTSSSTSGGQYVYTPPSSSGSNSSSGLTGGKNSAGLGFDSSDPNDSFFQKVAGTSTVNESDPSFFAIFTKLTSIGRDDSVAVLNGNTNESDAGRSFRYVAVFRNDTLATIGNVGFKITLPYQAQFTGSNIEPTETDYGFLSFDIGTLTPYEQKELVIETEISPDVALGTHLVFSSILVYIGQDGIERAVTSYSVLNITGVAPTEGDRNFLVALLGPLAVFANLLWLGILSLTVLAAYLIYRYRKNQMELVALRATLVEDSDSYRKVDLKLDESSQLNVPYNLPGIPVSEPLSPLRYRGNGNH